MVTRLSWRWEVLEMGSEDMELRPIARNNGVAEWHFRMDHTRSQQVGS